MPQHYETVTQAVGKRVVGKQNILPLLRDAADDDRDIQVIIDTEKSRYNGKLQAVSGTTEEHAVIGSDRRRTVRTRLVLAFQIVSVDGGTDPMEVRSINHMASQGQEPGSIRPDGRTVA